MSDPHIAVLIPAHNEQPVIQGTIQALFDAGVDRRDIYIIDDLSTDRTVDFAVQMGVNVAKAHENVGKARAQAGAIDHFDLLNRYDWVIFLDGDTKVDLYFFNAMFTATKTDPSVALYVGQVQSAPNSHIFSAIRAVDYTYGHDVAKHGQSNFNVVYVAPGCASMYRTDVLAELHIDHLTLAEDMDLTMQVHRRKEKVRYVPDAIVITQDPCTLKDYHKQILRWYRGFWQVAIKHKVFSPLAKKRPVDFYMMAITVDAIIFNKILWLIGILAILPQFSAALVAIDIATTFCVAAYAAHKTKRVDILVKFPGYYMLSFMNFYAFMRAFVEIVVMRKKILAWNKVKRYDFNSGIV